MQVKKYLNKDKPVLMYIHGECLSAFSFKEEVKELKKDYTLLLPLLDGHDADNPSQFVSIDRCAEEILQYIDETCNGHIHILSGFSLGGQIAVQMLAKRPDLCAYAMIESAMMKPTTIQNWSSYAGTYATALAKKKWFNKFMYYTIFNDDFAFEDYYKSYSTMGKESIVKVLDATHHYTLDENIQHATCKMAILIGQREKKVMKHSANLLHELVPNSQIFMLMNYTHGDFSLGNPREYLRFVKSWIQNKDIQQKRTIKKKEESGEYLPNWKHLMNKMSSKKSR